MNSLLEKAKKRRKLIIALLKTARMSLSITHVIHMMVINYIGKRNANKSIIAQINFAKQICHIKNVSQLNYDTELASSLHTLYVNYQILFFGMLFYRIIPSTLMRKIKKILNPFSRKL